MLLVWFRVTVVRIVYHLNNFRILSISGNKAQFHQILYLSIFSGIGNYALAQHCFIKSIQSEQVVSVLCVCLWKELQNLVLIIFWHFHVDKGTNFYTYICFSECCCMDQLGSVIPCKWKDWGKCVCFVILKVKNIFYVWSLHNSSPSCGEILFTFLYI